MNKKLARSVYKRLLGHITSHIGIGAVIVIPIIVVIFVLKWITKNSDNLLHLLTDKIPYVDGASGVGLVLLIIILYGIGILAANTFGKKIIHASQRLILEIPVIRSVYKPAKGFAEIFSSHLLASGRVVGTPSGIAGKFTLGLYTSDIEENGVDCINFYFITPPNPTTGLLSIVPRSEVYEIFIVPDDPAEQPRPMTITELIEYYSSSGASSPKKTIRRPLVPKG